MAVDIDSLPSPQEDDFTPLIETKIKAQNFISHLIDDYTILNQTKDCVDLNIVKTHFQYLGRLTKNQALKILHDCRIILKSEPNNIKVNAPCHIIGDLHGQYFDLLNITDRFDLTSDILVFLGDYVDRGIYSTETFLYLALLKIYYPDNIILLRGNHETRSMTSKYSFKSECIHKYDEEVYESFLSTFNTLPLSAVVMERLFCIHGGLAPGLNKVEDVNKIYRFTELQKKTLMRDILWADPHTDLSIKNDLNDELDVKLNTSDVKLNTSDVKLKLDNEDDFIAETDELYIKNKKRSYFFTYKSACKFLEDNNLKSIIRAHEVKHEGYEIYKNYKDYPAVITLFSAPNYCDENNKGSILYYDGSEINIKTFTSTSHPKLLPNNMDGINWTFPFISEKISEFYISLLRTINTTDDLDNFLLEKEIRKSARMQLSMVLVRTERENIGSPGKSDIFIDRIKLCKGKESDDQINVKGLSMDIPPSLMPDITKELSQLSLNKILKKSLIQYEEKNDKGEIYVPEENKEKGCPGWIF